MKKIYKNIEEIQIGDEIVIGTNFINKNTYIATRVVKEIHKEIDAVSYDDTGLVYFSNSDNTFLTLL